jgi:molecular chaperone HtpG
MTESSDNTIDVNNDSEVQHDADQQPTADTEINPAAETHEFQAQTRQVLQLVIHSLYSNKEIFLRELISNGSDACDRLRFAAIQNDALYEGDEELHIDIIPDSEAGTLTIQDNGIGMNREDVLENIGTIARSGTKAFLESLTGDQKADASLIGQFGVGFYSAFIVADRVTMLTRKAGDEPTDGVRWTSDGDGKFTIVAEDRPHHGTEIVLHLKEDEKSFLQAWNLKSLVHRYSDHIGFSIRMPEEASKSDDESDEATAEETTAEDTAVTMETINQAAALWTLPKSEISDEEYQSFYRYISSDSGDSLCWAHNKVEGSQSYTSLLYVPEKAPYDLMLQREEHTGLRLYVNRVFIMDAAQNLLPHYLRFLRGVVDSSDLPLNVSRELLQEDEGLNKIRSAVIRRTLDLLKKLNKDDAEKYATFWDQFGEVIKEGVVEDMANRDRITPLLRFNSTADQNAGPVVDLETYIGRMKVGQEAIYYVTAESNSAAASSPHLEVFRKNDIEVLLLSDRVDEWMMSYFHEHDGKSFKSVSKGDIDLGDLAEQKDEDEDEADHEELTKKIAEVLGERVDEVRPSNRLTDSASCLVLNEHEMALYMQQLMQQAGETLPESRPTLELNFDHPMVKLLEGENDDERMEDLSILLFEQAVLAEGGKLQDPAGFVKRINKLMLQN